MTAPPTLRPRGSRVRDRGDVVVVSAYDLPLAELYAAVYVGVPLALFVQARAAASLFVALFLALSVALYAATARRRVKVTRSGAWGQVVRLGGVVRSVPLGLHPRVQNLGYTWDEVAVFRRDEGDRDGFVLTEGDHPELLRVLAAAVDRLHGPPPPLGGAS